MAALCPFPSLWGHHRDSWTICYLKLIMLDLRKIRRKERRKERKEKKTPALLRKNQLYIILLLKIWAVPSIILCGTFRCNKSKQPHLWRITGVKHLARKLASSLLLNPHHGSAKASVVPTLQQREPARRGYSAFTGLSSALCSAWHRPESLPLS